MKLLPGFSALLTMFQKPSFYMYVVKYGILLQRVRFFFFQIAFIVLLYSLLCQRAYEPMEPYIDIEGLKEIAKYNSATLTISPGSSTFNSLANNKFLDWSKLKAFANNTSNYGPGVEIGSFRLSNYVSAFKQLLKNLL